MNTKNTILSIVAVALLGALSVLLYFSATEWKSPGDLSGATFTVDQSVTITPVPSFSAQTQTPNPATSPSPTLSPTPSPKPTPRVDHANISITGDLMVHEWQFEFAKNSDDTYNFEYSLDELRKYLTRADYTIGNLETTFSGEERGYSGYPMFRTPDSFADALKAAGFDFVTTANNHCNDGWEVGLLRTIEVLDKLNIEHTGTFASKEQRDMIFVKEINGLSFAFVSYTYGTNGLPLSDGKPWLANIMDEEQMVEDIKKARALEPDFVVMMPHMGNEYETYPKQIFKDWVSLMLRSGADLVIAGHPHVLQPVEFFRIIEKDGSEREAFVAYSLGNLISSQRTEPRESGIIMNYSFEKKEGEKAKLVEVSYVPTWVKFKDADGQYDIKAVAVYDVLKDSEAGGATAYTSADIERLKRVHAETTEMFLGEALPLEEIKESYVLPKPEPTLLDLR